MGFTSNFIHNPLNIEKMDLIIVLPPDPVPVVTVFKKSLFRILERLEDPYISAFYCSNCCSHFCSHKLSHKSAAHCTVLLFRFKSEFMGDNQTLMEF